MRDEHPLVQLARRAIESWIRNHHRIDPSDFTIPETSDQAGVFVSLHRQGQLRGCIGTVEPTRESVAQEVIDNAIASATRDPRFPGLGPSELAGLEIKVDVLTRPEPIVGPEELDPRRYGVIVESNWRRGLLLPDLEGVDTTEQQLAIARQKAGIGRHEPAQLYRFEVVRYT